MAWALCPLFTVNKSAQTITLVSHTGSKLLLTGPPRPGPHPQWPWHLEWAGSQSQGGDTDGPEPLKTLGDGVQPQRLQGISPP